MLDEQKFKQDMETLAREEGRSQKEIDLILESIQELLDKSAIPDIDFSENNNIALNEKEISMLSIEERIGRTLALEHATWLQKNALIEKIKSNLVVRAVEDFKKAMPPIDACYPEIYYISDKNKKQEIKEIADKIQTNFVEYNVQADVSYLHGKKSDAILILVDNIIMNVNYDYMDLIHSLWRCLARFYVVSQEPQYWYESYETHEAFKETKNYDKIASFLGYHMWSDFITTVIFANVMSIVHDFSPLECDNVHIKSLLSTAFTDTKVDLLNLMMHFAFSFIEKQNDCIPTAPNVAQPFLQDMQELFAEQMKKEQYWITNEEMLEHLGLLFAVMDKEWTTSVIKEKRAVANREKQREQKAKKKARKEATKSRNRSRRKR